MTTAAERPQHLHAVPDLPPATAPLEGVVVKAPPTEPGALARAGQHVADHRGYIPLALRGYRRIGAAWADRYHGDWPLLIDTVRREYVGASVERQEELKGYEGKRRRAYLLHRATYAAQTGGWALAGGTGITVGTAAGGAWVALTAGIISWGYGIWRGAGEDPTAQADSQPAPLALINAPAEVGVTAQGITVDQVPNGTAPFPVRQAGTPDQLAVCVLAAMRKHNIPVAEVFEISRQPWGWQCTVRVSEGTPEVIIKAAGDLETAFDLGANGVRVQPLQSRRACAILRLVETNPFATAPAMPYRPPKSLSITDRFRIGTSVGGDPLDICLAGVMGLWVAASGGGKTGILQALAEGVTACRDNITIDLDPHGDGLEDLGDAVRITARTHEQIEAVLLFLLVMSKARARLRAKLGMGKKWIASPEHPAVTVFFDEFPKGSDLAKELAFQLLLVGRKELIEVQLASQGGTKLYLGENIAQMIALRGVGPCKVGDTRAVFGDGAVAEGWLPHTLSPATDTDPKDAGHIYLQGVPGRADEAIEYAVHETPSAVLRQLAEERLAAGLVEPDQESLAAMAGVDLPDIPDLPPLLSWPALLRLCDAQPPADGSATAPIITEAVAVMDERQVDRMRTERLAEALGLTADELKAKLRFAGVSDPTPLGEMDGLKNPRGYKRDQLLAA